MTPNDLFNIVYGDQSRITEAITTGSAWEIWIQVEMVLITRAAGYNAARELPYPNSAQKLDLMIQDRANQKNYAVEMKVESAQNAGAAIVAQLRNDMAKIVAYNAPDLAGRWVLGIGYSNAACTAMQTFANADPAHRQFHHQNGLGVIIIVVS